MKTFCQGRGIDFALLLMMLALRVWNLTVQDAYLDEGYHIRQALEVWSFEDNPGRVAHGERRYGFWRGFVDEQVRLIG